MQVPAGCMEDVFNSTDTSIKLTLILPTSTLPSICEMEGHLSGYPSQAPKLLESPLLRTQSANHTVI